MFILHTTCRVAGVDYAKLSDTYRFHEHNMALKSKFPDVAIPESMSWPEFVYQNFDKYGDTTAIVSTNTNGDYVVFAKFQRSLR